MGLDAQSPNTGYAEAALAAAERARARSLQDMLAGKSIDLSHTLAPGLAEEQREAAERLNAAAVQFTRLAAKANTGSRRARADAVDAASRALDEVRGRVRAADPRYADLLQPVDLRVADIQQQLLDADTAILEYWLGRRASYLWIVKQRSLGVVVLPPRPVIERLSRDLRAHCIGRLGTTDAAGFAGLAAAEAKQTAAIQQAAEKLERAVLPSKVLRALPSRIVVVADAGLEGIPFGLLPLGSTGETLGARHDLSYLPSINTLQSIRRQQRTRNVRSDAVAVIAAPAVASTDLPPLPYARAEAESIASLLPKGGVWLALGTDASRAHVLSADWHQYAIAHFAAHALVDRSRPELSGIVLSPEAGGPTQDGILRVNDIYNLDMPVNLVVLSSCETAAGRGLDSEGVFSLSRAFFYAGAARVIASLWRVDDRATAEFMQAFYQALLIEHTTVAGALRFAQQHLGSDSRWANPYYWAGFVLQGDWT
jgi:hypothetical protein